MNIRTSLIDRLKAAVPLVSSRVHRIKAPQDTTKAYIATTLLDPGRRYHLGNTTSGLFVARVQAMCFAKTYDDAAAVGAQVITAMEGWPATTTDVQAVNLLEEDEEYNVDTELYGVYLTFQVFHK